MAGDFHGACAHLASADERMAALIEIIGPCTLVPRRGRYAALVRAIIGQQVSTAAARTIYARLAAAAGGRLTPDAVAALSPAELRAAGLSGQKASYVRDLSERVLDGRLRLQRMHLLEDEAVIEELVGVRGIGRWTAEMFLMFVLCRPDILPVDDLGIRNGFRRVYGLRKMPSVARMHQLARPWRPWRTVGSWYLWRALELPPAARAGD